MKKILLVAAREYLESVKTKTFIIMILLVPLMYAVMAAIMALNTADDKRYKVLDATGGQLYEVQKAAVEAANAAISASDSLRREPRFFLLDDEDAVLNPEAPDFAERFAAARRRLGDELQAARGTQGLFAYFVIGPEFLTDDYAVTAGDAVEYSSKNKGFTGLRDFMTRTLRLARGQLRAREALEDYVQKHPEDRRVLRLERREVPPAEGKVSGFGFQASGSEPPRLEPETSNLKPQTSTTAAAPFTCAVLDETGRFYHLPPMLAQLEAQRAAPAEVDADTLAQALRRATAYRQHRHMLEFALDVQAAARYWRLADWQPPPLKGTRRPDEIAAQMAGVDRAALAHFFGDEDDEAPGAAFDDALAQARARIAAGTLDAVVAIRHAAFRLGADRPAAAAGDWEGWRDGAPAGPAGDQGDAALPRESFVALLRPGLPAEALVTLERLWRDELWRQRFLHVIQVTTLPVEIRIRDERGTEVSKGEAILNQFMPYMFVIFMMIGIMTVSQLLLTNVVEEKSNRIVEVLLSSVSPFQLMFGKVIGLGAMGFTILALWAVGGYSMAWSLVPAELIGRFVRPAALGYFLLFYVLGFLLYASLLAAIGSACTTLKEAQNLQAPVSMLMIIPIALSLGVGQDPNALANVVATYIPPFTPFIMMARLASSTPPGALEVWGSVALLAASVAGTIWLAGRIFRVGVLMYGKPPRLRELLRWVRYR